uniref:SER_THR_PHOSPHATASE domain-containing protein n=1 Tax=Caenorhabditis tropicalis TaxID=1561998 RepID=A0A1I7V085_9PELO
MDLDKDNKYGDYQTDYYEEKLEQPPTPPQINTNALEKFSPVNGNKLYEKFNEAFSWMPLAAIVGEKIFCVHGGISPKLASWNDISNIPRPLLEVTDNELATDLLFSDPLDYDIVHIPKNKPNFETNYLRQKSVLFNEPSVDEFCKEFNIKLIIRSHTYVPFGYRFFADRKLITIFSSSGYRDQRKNNSTDTGVSTDCTSNLSISSRGPMGSEAGLSSQILKY